MGSFVPGLALARAFYEEIVAPLVVGTEHSAALLGTGSDVLGFDTERATDHGWGPRLQVFVAGADIGRVRNTVERELPDEFRGWPMRYGWDDYPVTHHVEVHELDVWLCEKLGFDPREPLSTRGWLTVPSWLWLLA